MITARADGSRARQLTPLGVALAAHRDQHPGCRGCPEYLDLCRRSVEGRQVWAGPVAACTVLSVREGRKP